MKDRLAAWGYGAGWTLVKALPEPVARRLFAAAAAFAYRKQGKGTRRLAANLTRVVPPGQVEAATRAGLQSYARYWLEAFRLPVMSPAEIDARVHCPGEDYLRRMTNERGAVAVLAHMGNWDIAGAWASVNDLKLTTVAERLKPESLYDRFLEFRESLGMEVLPLTGGDVNTVEVLADRLRAKRLVALLGDRDLTARGIEVTFFGATAKFPAGPAALALRTGAALLPVTMWAEGDAWFLDIGQEIPPSDIPTMTQAAADAFETAIRAHPEDWHMLQRLWV